MTHIEAISNGLGAPSVYMLILAREDRIPARLSITADTGAEFDRVWSNGERTTAREYFTRVVDPLAREAGIEAVLVEALDKSGAPTMPLWDWVKRDIDAGRLNHLKIPLFGSDGGRLRQPCTSRKKVAAIRQELRRRGATSARMAHGLHRGEVRRMKGRDGRMEAGFYTLTDFDAQWTSHYYPLIEFGLFRADIREALDKIGIPWLLSSECDMCPHKDWTRWERTSPAVIAEIAEYEAKMGGEFFFTDKRIPLHDALALMRQEAADKRAAQSADMFDDPDFGCDEGAVCGV